MAAAWPLQPRAHRQPALTPSARSPARLAEIPFEPSAVHRFGIGRAPYAERAMNDALALEFNTQRELLRRAVDNHAHGVPLLLIVAGVVVHLGFLAQQVPVSVAVGGLWVVIAAWRFMTYRRHGGDRASEQTIARARWELDANAAASGMLWAISTVMIYPALHGSAAALYVAMVCGSIGVAALSMSLFGRAFALLTAFQTLALAWASLQPGEAHSLPLAVLAVLYGLACGSGARNLRVMTTRAIASALELQQANAWLQEAKVAADASSAAKGNFLANMSHEIRTPLTAIIGFSEERGPAGPSREEQLDNLRTIHRAGKHLLSLVNDILDLSKIDAGKLEIELSPMPLRPLIDEVAHLSGAGATSKGLHLTTQFDYPLPRTLVSSPQHLRQILHNLLGNAIKFTPAGTVTLRVSSAGDRLSIAITDSGIGITEDGLARLFEPFNQADNSIMRRFGGTGLGLALSRRLAHGLGGTLEVRSVMGTGSCFTLSIPIVEPDVWLDGPDAPPDAPPATSPTEGAWQVQGRILLADDNADNQRLICRHVGGLGASIEVVADGKAAVEAARATPFDLILMDMQMPEMDGLTAVRVLREGGYRMPIAMLTANATREHAAECTEAGCDAFLTKPIVRLQFDDVVRRHLPPADGPHAVRPAVIDDSPIVSSLLDEDPDMADLVDYFVGQLPVYRARLDAALDSSDAAALARLGHDLKAVGEGYGYPQVSEFGRALERTLLAEPADQTRQRFGAMTSRIVVGQAGVQNVPMPDRTV
ncbi:MAG: ATP-binding protein [Burkholderiales bacterium]